MLDQKRKISHAYAVGYELTRCLCDPKSTPSLIGSIGARLNLLGCQLRVSAFEIGIAQDDSGSALVGTLSKLYAELEAIHPEEVAFHCRFPLELQTFAAGDPKHAFGNAASRIDLFDKAATPDYPIDQVCAFTTDAKVSKEDADRMIRYWCWLAYEYHRKRAASVEDTKKSIFQPRVKTPFGHIDLDELVRRFSLWRKERTSNRSA